MVWLASIRLVIKLIPTVIAFNRKLPIGCYCWITVNTQSNSVSKYLPQEYLFGIDKSMLL